MEKPRSKIGFLQIIISTLATILVFLAITMVLGGDWHWIEGWIFVIWISVMVIILLSYLYFKDPALLNERAQAPGSKNQKPWDKYLLIFFYICTLVWSIIMPLDAKRFSWSPIFPIWIKIIGGLILLPALYFLIMPTIENTYLSALVRIQDDRKQQVISTGVYSFVRHPLYFGYILMMFGAPLLLGSVFGIIIAIIGLMAIMLRIIGEERMLSSELEGYEEYKKKVKYHLLKYIW